jgi:hypothetical protein
MLSTSLIMKRKVSFKIYYGGGAWYFLISMTSDFLEDTLSNFKIERVKKTSLKSLKSFFDNGGAWFYIKFK